MSIVSPPLQMVLPGSSGSGRGSIAQELRFLEQCEGKMYLTLRCKNVANRVLTIVGASRASRRFQTKQPSPRSTSEDQCRSTSSGFDKSRHSSLSWPNFGALGLTSRGVNGLHQGQHMPNQAWITKMQSRPCTSAVPELVWL